MISFWIGSILIFIGLFMILTTIIGLFRLKNVFYKMHSASLTESLGMPLIFLGLAIINWPSNLSFKYILLMILVFIIAPTNTHALSKMIYYYKKTNKDS